MVRKVVYRIYEIATVVMSFPLFLGMLLTKRGRARLLDRYGSWGLTLGDCLWLHGASVGEVNALSPVVRALKVYNQSLPILLTSTSITGLDKGEQLTEHRRLLPFDASLWIGRALRGIHPKLFMFGETEIWPCLIHYLADRKVPLVLVNGRISDSTFVTYLNMKPLLEPALKRLSKVLASSELAKERFVAIGVPEDIVVVTGNSKYDVKPPNLSIPEKEALRSSLFHDDSPILTLGSLRPGEESWWLPAIKSAWDEGKKFNVVLAPRHSEKYSFFAEALAANNISFVRRSEGRAADGLGNQLVLLDTMGELAKVYGVSALSFIGATLVRIGGHNPLEPAAVGSCVCFGAFTNNAADIAAEMVAKECAIRIAWKEEIPELLARLSARDPSLQIMASRGQELWKSYTGAAEKIVKEVAQFL